MTGFSVNEGASRDYSLYNIEEFNQLQEELSLSNTWQDSSLARSSSTGSTTYANPANVVSLPVSNAAAATITDSSFTYRGEDSSPTATQFTGNVFANLTTQFAEGTLTARETSQAIFHYNHPELPPPPRVAEMLDEALVEALASFPEVEDAQLLSFQARVGAQSSSDEEIGRAFDQAFESIIKGKPNEAALRQAHYMRDSNAPLTAEEQQALEQISAEFGVPTDGSYIPQVDKQSFIDSMNMKYDSAFQEALNKSSLSESDKALVKHLYFNPSTEVPSTIKDALASLNAEVRGEFLQANALPQTWSLTPTSSMYNAGMNGFFNEYLQREIGAYLQRNPTNPSGQPWTAEERAALVNNPEIRKNAVDAVMTRYNLAGIEWQPAPSGTFPTVGTTTMNTIADAEEIFSNAQVLVDQMPAGPTKTSYLNILAQLSNALQALKTALYEGQGATSEQMRLNSQAKLDMALASIKKQLEGSEEIQKKQEKTRGMNIFTQIINAIMALVMLLASAATMNPVGVALATMMFIDTVAPQAKCIDKMFKTIEKAVAAMLPGISPQGLKFFQMAAKIAVIAAMLPASGIVAIQAGPSLLEKSGLMKDMIKMCGGTDQQAEMGNMIFNIVVGAVVTIVMVVVGIVFTAGVGAGGAIANMVAKVTEASMQGAKASLRALQIAAEVAQSAITIATSCCALATSLIMRDIALIKANLKADKVTSDAEIENLIKLINKLIQSLMGGSEFITMLTQAQSQLHSKAIATTTAISSA